MISMSPQVALPLSRNVRVRQAEVNHRKPSKTTHDINVKVLVELEGCLCHIKIDDRENP